MTDIQLPTSGNHDDRLRHLLDLTTEIIASHVASTSIPSDDLPGLIGKVFSSLNSLRATEDEGQGSARDTSSIASGAVAAPVQTSSQPAVPISESVQSEYLVCLEDGKKVKLLHRYLKNQFRMTPAEYRKKWGLPADYPMVAPAYSESRRAHALQIGFMRREEAPAAAPVAAPAPVASTPPARKAASEAPAKPKGAASTSAPAKGNAQKAPPAAPQKQVKAPPRKSDSAAAAVAKPAAKADAPARAVGKPASAKATGAAASSAKAPAKADKRRKLGIVFKG